MSYSNFFLLNFCTDIKKYSYSKNDKKGNCCVSRRTAQMLPGSVYFDRSVGLWVRVREVNHSGLICLKLSKPGSNFSPTIPTPAFTIIIWDADLLLTVIKKVFYDENMNGVEGRWVNMKVALLLFKTDHFSERGNNKNSQISYILLGHWTCDPKNSNVYVCDTQP